MTAAPARPSQDAALPADAAARAAWAMTLALLWVVALRTVAWAMPSMYLWGFNTQRFLPPAIAWATALAVPVALLFGDRLARPLHRMGRLTAAGAPGLVLWAGFAAALVLAFPDRTHMTGDFILRQRAIENEANPALLFPQAMPLDVWLHYTLPRMLFQQFGLAPSLVARVWGAASAAFLAATAVTFARALRLRDLPALVAVTLVVGSGALGLFTGYGKGYVDLVCAVAAVGTIATLVVSRNEGHLRLALCSCFALAVHRMGVFVLPALAVTWVLALRHHGAHRRLIAGIALCALALATCLPQAVRSITTIDATYHLPTSLPMAHWVDVFNALTLVAPWLPALPILAFVFGRRVPWRVELLPLAVLALSILAPTLVVMPQQGILRDWDVYAPAGIALSMLAAWFTAEILDSMGTTTRSVNTRWRAPAAAALTLAAMLATAGPAFGWLVHLGDERLGMRRVTAALHERPMRSTLERARLWDYLGVRSAWLDDRTQAAHSFRESAALLPTPRVLGQWATAEVQATHWDTAREAALQWTTRAPNDLVAWRTLAAATTQLNDRPESRRAAEQILRLNPADADARDILEYLGRTEPGAGR